MALAVAAGGASLTAPYEVARPASETPPFLSKALGSRDESATLTRTPAKHIAVRIDRSGYSVVRSDTSVSLASEDVGIRSWEPSANGASRATAFGRETVIVDKAKAEQFLTVDEHQGLKTWSWVLRASNARPRLTVDGTVEFDAGGKVRDLFIPAVALFDARGRDITAAGLGWSLRRVGSSWRLELRLDDSKLPLPYVIDPAIVFKSSSTAGNMGTTATLAIPKPVGAVAGDFLIAQVTVRDNPTITAPAGWTLVRSDTKSPGLKQAIYWRVAGAELGPYTWTFSSTQFASGGIIAYTGVDPSNPINASSGNTGNSTTLTALAVTTTVSDAMVVGFFGIARSTTLTPEASMTFRYTVDSGGMGGATAHTMSMAADFTQATPGSTGNKTATAGQAADWVAQLVALRPAIRSTSTVVDCPASTPANTPVMCTVRVRDIDSGTRSPPQGTVDFEFTAQPAGSTATVAPDPCTLAPDPSTMATDDSFCTITFTADTVGSYTIKGTYQPLAGSVHGASSGSDTILVTARSTSTVVDCPASTPANTPVMCTVTVKDIDTAPKSPPLGDVDFEITAQPAGSTATVAPDPCTLAPDPSTTATDDSFCTITFTADTVGSYTIKGTYQPAPGSPHETSNGSDTILVTARSTSTVVDCPASTPANTPVMCKVTVKDIDTAPKSPPLGDVDFTFTSQPPGSTPTITPDPCALAPDPSTTANDDSFCTIEFNSTKAGDYTIKGTYQPAPGSPHETSNGSDTIKVTPGPPAIVTVERPAAVNQVNSEHCVTATVTDAFGNPVAGVKVFFTVTGVNPASGSSTTNASGQADFCYTGRLFGEDLITAVADRNGNGSPDPGEPTGTATKTWTLPPSTPLCTVDFPTYGGLITANNGDKANFGGNAHVSDAGDSSGQEEYQDKGPANPMNVHSISVLSVVCATVPIKEAQIYGEATIDGSGRYNFRIDVKDIAEPGVGNDTYRITIRTPTPAVYDSGERTLEGGNVQIH
jgi:hypothetical protein